MATSKKLIGETLFDLTSFVADTHVNPFQQQASATEQTTHDTYGLGSGKPLANYDQNTQSWRMYEATLLSDSPPFLETWPPSGMTRNGKLFPLPQLAHHIEETESLSWPTPRVTGSGEDISIVQERFKNGLKYKSRLEEAVALWPTMTANGMGSTGHRELLNKRISSGDITPDEKRQMSAGNGGRLNPTWVEWLMGFPLEWTDLKDSETP
jgi:hypothetical protein